MAWTGEAGRGQDELARISRAVRTRREWAPRSPGAREEKIVGGGGTRRKVALEAAMSRRRKAEVKVRGKAMEAAVAMRLSREIASERGEGEGEREGEESWAHSSS